MKKIIKGIAIYQCIFGLLGLVAVFSSVNSSDLKDLLLGLLFFFLSIVSGVLLFIKRTTFVGHFLSIFNNLLQSVIIIVGNVWFQYQAGIAVGFGYHRFMRNEWVGRRNNLIWNIGANYRLMFNDHNTDLYIGINILALVLVIILAISIRKYKKE